MRGTVGVAFVLALRTRTHRLLPHLLHSPRDRFWNWLSEHPWIRQNYLMTLDSYIRGSYSTALEPALPLLLCSMTLELTADLACGHTPFADVTILSRVPVESVECLPFPSRMERQLLVVHARINEHPVGSISFPSDWISLHLPVSPSVCPSL